MVALVLSKALSGDYKSNPICFKHCDIDSICLYADNIPVNGNVLKLDFSSANGPTFMRAFTELFQNTGKWKNDAGNDISREDFINGNSLFVFQLEPFFADHGSYLSLMKTGNVRLDIQFKTALTGMMFYNYYHYYQFIKVEGIDISRVFIA